MIKRKVQNHPKQILTCLIASTKVTVFPVPGGPNTRYGAGRDDPDKIF